MLYRRDESRKACCFSATKLAAKSEHETFLCYVAVWPFGVIWQLVHIPAISGAL